MVDGQALQAHWWRQGTHFWLQAALDELQGEDLRLQPATLQHSGRSGAVLAPMHGRVVRIEVQAGQAVAAGQTLLVMEAMKMEHRLVAPCAGQVQSLQARVGEQVAARRVLAQIAPEPT